MNNMKRNACQKCVFAVRDDNPHCGLRGFRSDFNVEWCESESDRVPNGYELQEDGYFSWVEKKKEYPKTYEECCKIIEVPYLKNYVAGYKNGLLDNFQKLLICRDAYWKIYGEENGLGKPWEPDCTRGYFIPAIIYRSGSIQKVEVHYRNAILIFPTAEMRDVFYENFKELIEQCKELL